MRSRFIWMACAALTVLVLGGCGAASGSHSSHDGGTNEAIAPSDGGLGTDSATDSESHDAQFQDAAEEGQACMPFLAAPCDPAGKPCCKGTCPFKGTRCCQPVGSPCDPDSKWASYCCPGSRCDVMTSRCVAGCAGAGEACGGSRGDCCSNMVCTVAAGSIFGTCSPITCVDSQCDSFPGIPCCDKRLICPPPPSPTVSSTCCAPDGTTVQQSESDLCCSGGGGGNPDGTFTCASGP